MLGTQVVAGENALTSTYLLKAVTVPYLEGKFTCWNAGFSNNQFERFFATFLLMTWLDRCKFVPFLGMYFSAVLCNTPILHPLSDWLALFNQLLPWQYRHINRMSLLSLQDTIAGFINRIHLTLPQSTACGIYLLGNKAPCYVLCCLLKAALVVPWAQLQYNLIWQLPSENAKHLPTWVIIIHNAQNVSWNICMLLEFLVHAVWFNHVILLFL